MPAKRSKTRANSPRLPQADIGILGGTGLYAIDGIENVREYKLKTPLGEPSDAYNVGILEGRKVAFLSRHGRGHRHLPSDINYRANVYGFKMLGVKKVISVSSVGSLRAEIRPREIVFADQFFDKTHRRSTFFGEGVVAHIGFAQPVCGDLSKFLCETAVSLGIPARLGGTYVCMEGPAFSTKAESRIHRLWGGDIIGMTGATEAKLFREAEICYATMNLVTDFDCWHESEETVSVDLVLENLRSNIENAKAIIKKAVAGLPAGTACACGCGNALRGAIMTDPRLIPAATKRRLDLIIGRYIRRAEEKP
jgi:5'-methylthioadenosine phosphorylase